MFHACHGCVTQVTVVSRGEPGVNYFPGTGSGYFDKIPGSTESGSGYYFLQKIQFTLLLFVALIVK